jgi:small subunit ribosomal protein S4
VALTSAEGRQHPSMTKRQNAKYKINRRLGVNLWGRAKSPINARDYGPGEHGQRKRKPTDYGLQLMAKQKLKGYYGNVSESQFYRYYEEAVRRRGDTSENLIGLLERRLDAIVYRAKFAPTVFAARQFVNHGLITVNGRRVNIPSYLIKEGDIIEPTDRAKQFTVILEASQQAERDVPDYIGIEGDKLRATFVRTPKLADVPYPVQMEPNLVVEYYSR